MLWNPGTEIFPAPRRNNLWHASMILSLIHETGVFQSERIEHCSTYVYSEQVVEMDFAYDYSLYRFDC